MLDFWGTHATDNSSKTIDVVEITKFRQDFKRGKVFVTLANKLKRFFKMIDSTTANQYTYYSNELGRSALHTLRLQQQNLIVMLLINTKLKCTGSDIFKGPNASEIDTKKLGLRTALIIPRCSGSLCIGAAALPKQTSQKKTDADCFN